MAKSRKPGRPKGSKNKSSSRQNVRQAVTIDPVVRNQIIAVLLFVIAFLVLVSSFGFGGPLGIQINRFFRLFIGWTVFVLPIVLVGIGYSLFHPDDYDITATTGIGLVLSLLSFSGIFHIFIKVDASLAAASAGSNGGYVGYYLQKLFLAVFNAPVSFVVMLAFSIIGMLLATNTPISGIGGLFRKDDDDQEIAPKNDIKIHETAPANKGVVPDLKRQDKERAEQPVMATVDTSGWKLPPLNLFGEMTTRADSGNVRENAATIQKTLSNFGVEVSMGDVNVGPTVTQYTLKPNDGVKLEKITSLDKNLALSLAAHPIRIEAPIPGKSLVGVEMPNKTGQVVRMRNILSSQTFKERKSKLSVVLGLDVAGHPQIADITKMPHLLIAGSTGSGKSVCINSLLLSLIYQNTPQDLKLILVDPKRVELSLYNGIAHLLTPVIVEPDKTVSALKWAVAEMERRYNVLQQAGKRNIGEYNAIKKGKEAMPFIVIVIDELADLMAVSANEVEGLICRLAQMARAVGIHLVVATQRPSVDVITGLIKANIPTRIAFSVASNTDSRTILDQSGAEKLLGMGDMLFLSAELSKPRRIQGAYVSEQEVKAVTEFVKTQAEPDYNQEILAQNAKAGHNGDMSDIDDDLFMDAAECVIRAGKASASLLQRRLRIGYARAARLLDILEDRGIVGPQDGARPRDVLVDDMSDVTGEVDRNN